MFSIRKFQSATLFRYSRPIGPYALPYAMENVRRVMQRFRNVFGREHTSAHILTCLEWQPDCDPVYDLLVESWLSILKMFWGFIFPVPGTPLLPEMHLQLLTSCGLVPEFAVDLMLLSSHTTALLANAEDANDALINGVISAGDPMYIPDPVKCFRGLFSDQECDFEPLAFFLQEWERAWSRPSDFFSGSSGMTRFLIADLERREEGADACFSIEFYISFFIAFFDVFVHRNSVSQFMRRMMLERFFKDIISKFSVFYSMDLAFQLMQAYLRVSGIICASCNPSEWMVQSPICSYVTRLPSRKFVYSFFSIWEEKILSRCLPLAFNQDLCARWLLFIYGDSGRDQSPFAEPMAMVRGGLSASLIWEMWRSVYVPSLSQFLLNFTETLFRPLSLEERASFNIFRVISSGIIPFDLSFYCTLLDTISLVDVFENSSRSGVFWNNAFRKQIVQTLRLQVLPSPLILRTLHIFSNQLDLNASSSEGHRTCAYNLLFVMLKLLPLCPSNVWENIRLRSLAEWFLKHLFVLSGLLNQGNDSLTRIDIKKRNIVVALGSERVGASLLSLILYALDMQEDPNLLEQVRVGFLRNFCVLYEQSFR